MAVTDIDIKGMLAESEMINVARRLEFLESFMER